MFFLSILTVFAGLILLYFFILMLRDVRWWFSFFVYLVFLFSLSFLFISFVPDLFINKYGYDDSIAITLLFLLLVFLVLSILVYIKTIVLYKREIK